jgi:hypothetical protein
MSAVITKPMPMQFESDDLDDYEVLDRFELLLDPYDLVALDRARQRARKQGAEIVVRQALVGEEPARHMLVFGYVIVVPDGSPTIWKGTLTALEKAVAS